MKFDIRVFFNICRENSQVIKFDNNNGALPKDQCIYIYLYIFIYLFISISVSLLVTMRNISQKIFYIKPKHTFYVQ